MDELALAGGRILNGLLAGTYLAFLLAVMPALHGQPDDVFTRVMNQINVVIVNPAFLVLFLGAPLTAGGLVWWHRTPTAIAAAALAVAALAITVAANVPLNHALARGAARGSYEARWLVWHTLRTLTAIGAFALLSLPEHG